MEVPHTEVLAGLGHIVENRQLPIFDNPCGRLLQNRQLTILQLGKPPTVL
jgi:hypothetical protein